MNNPERLSSLQVILLLINGRVMSELIYQPAIVTPPANQDVWVAEILALLYLFIICGPLLFLTSRFETMTPLEYSEKILGKILGKVLGLGLVAVLLLFSQLHIKLAIDFLEAVVLPETPPYATALFMLIPCVYLIYKGVEGMGRLIEMVMPTFLAAIILFTLLNVKDMKFDVFLPVLADSTFSQISYGAWSIASRFTEIIILGMLAPHIKEKKRTTRIFAYAAVISTGLLLIITVSVQARLGIILSTEEIFPYYAYVRQISAYDVIERVESLNVFIWFIGLFLKFSLYLYLALLGLAQIFSLKSPRVLIIPAAMVLYIVALETPLARSVVADYLLSYRVLPYISFIAIFIIPAVMLAGYYFRRLSGRCGAKGL